MPHRPLEQLDENLWKVDGEVPGIPGLHRTMTIVRRPDGTLAFFNAVPVDEPTLAALRSLGTPRDLIIPQPLHMLDAHPFRERLGLRVFAPATTRNEVARQVPVAGAFEDLPADGVLEVESVPGFKTGEGRALVRSGPRVSLLVADLVVNTPRAPGLAGLVFHLIGLTGDRPRLPPPVRLRVVRDRRAVRGALERLAATPGLTRIVPTHGPVIDREPAGALREIAARL
jgi:hypothetical protein